MRFNFSLIAPLITLLISGCASVPAGKSVVTDLSGKPDASEVEFWHTLQNRALATHDDAFHGLLLYLDGDDPCTSYADRVATLKQRGMLPRDFAGGADEAIERGTLAVSLVKALNLKGGLSMQLFGASPRYALRELVYRRIYPESSDKQLFSGAEYLGVIGRVQDYREGDPANVPAKVLYVGAEPTPTLSEIDPTESPTYPSFLSTAALNFSLLQPATSEPSSKPAQLTLPDGPLKLVITGVRGKAETRVPPEEKWTKAETNAELSEGTELRTGIKSAVQLQIRPDQTITVDRLGVVKIDRATLASGKFVTSVSMPYGRTRYDIDASNREYDATVRSPNSTLGIRGTRVSLLDQKPFPPEAVSLTGTAQFQNIRRQLVALGRPGQGKTKVVGGQSNATEYALDQAVVDPVVAAARTDSEQPLVATLLSSGAVFEINRDLGIPVVRGGTHPLAAPGATMINDPVIPLLPGRLDFVARWDADVDFNLLVSTPGTDTNIGGESIFAAPGLTKSPTGGTLAFDHRGGSAGGIELTHWDNSLFPTGLYAVAVQNNSNKTAHVRSDVFLDKQPVLTTAAQFPELGLPPDFEGDILPGQSLLAFYDISDPAREETGTASAAKVKASKKPSKSARSISIKPTAKVPPIKTVPLPSVSGKKKVGG